jgi:transposase InsO family protein
MKTEIALRKQAIALHLQGWKKSEIARKVQRSRRWVQRWIGRYEPDAPTASLQAHSHKYYLMVLRDKRSKKTALRALANKRMDAILDFLVSAWQKLGCPKRLKMDNCLDFRGSNRHPRSPSKLMRVCLELGVQPVFIPLREPWRNGVGENLNGLLNRFLFRTQTFETEKQLHKAVQSMETTINTPHRLSALEGKTPQEFTANARLRYPPAHYDWRMHDLRLLKGKVMFIRLVRKSGRITLTANDKFLIGKKYKWQYVIALVDVVKKKLNVIWQGKRIKSFDYS